MKLDDLLSYLPLREKPTEEKVLLDEVHDKGDWLLFLNQLLSAKSITPALQKAFQNKWIETGHFIRSKLDDDQAVVHLLSNLMPKYQGEGMIVFRGENEHRFNSGHVGFCWTPNREVAEMFGRGLNACNGQGMLLQAYAPNTSIFSGPNEHSRYLGEDEVTVDPAKLVDLQIIGYYPMSH